MRSQHQLVSLIRSLPGQDHLVGAEVVEDEKKPEAAQTEVRCVHPAKKRCPHCAGTCPSCASKQDRDDDGE